ncbi:hypothetical protein C1Y18_10345 [Pseudomonas sp. MPR-R5A]|nr:hypothetical protein C1Y25_19360 [Pseudomonas sp. MPBC4-3]PMX26027.1 hypothetical protein C1Y23_13145 [Pseudomonas sp. GW460-12]PMX33135.1 hypothetical protein C1Y24_18440 [Pseudomonas sp. MPR-R2A4]PMX40901.1 hypothetical protein C1Y26_12740 [Pseudomonas sp. MPR-R2A7]PMX48584.1 hypothetical protein C1Y20_09425 [Pseudomonas sp. FW301-21B01]PMX53393.1 hypothetical protein C1Y17_13825 [Pseudomonas sp. MPR-R2A6]PMX92171.1 hypothetical protein C1Y21_07915 [Pseudomonas sp. MPR-R2A3]PMY08235.1 h
MLTQCVGASLLAKNLRAPLSIRLPAFSLTFFASKLAPTWGAQRFTATGLEYSARLLNCSNTDGYAGRST